MTAERQQRARITCEYDFRRAHGGDRHHVTHLNGLSLGGVYFGRDRPRNFISKLKVEPVQSRNPGVRGDGSGGMCPFAHANI
jgi:hypothetical protein